MLSPKNSLLPINPISLERFHHIFLISDQVFVRSNIPISTHHCEEATATVIINKCPHQSSIHKSANNAQTHIRGFIPISGLLSPSMYPPCLLHHISNDAAPHATQHQERVEDGNTHCDYCCECQSRCNGSIGSRWCRAYKHHLGDLNLSLA